MSTVNLLAEAQLIGTNLGVIQNVWDQRFLDFSSSYSEAYNTAKKQLDDERNHDRVKVLTAALAQIGSLAARPFGVYGMAAQVIIAGLKELANESLAKEDVPSLTVPSPLTYAMDLLKYSKQIFTPLLKEHRDLTAKAVKVREMDAAKFKKLLSHLLMSPLWYPPDEVQKKDLQLRTEVAIWAMYFDHLRGLHLNNYELRFFSDLVPYLANRLSPEQKAGWRWLGYGKVISQGGSGGWDDFIVANSAFWQRKLETVVTAGWLLPLPVTPDWAKDKITINWTAPRPSTFKTPAGGKGSITVTDVQETLPPTIEWKQISALK